MTAVFRRCFLVVLPSLKCGQVVLVLIFPGFKFRSKSGSAPASDVGRSRAAAVRDRGVKPYQVLTGVSAVENDMVVDASQSRYAVWAVAGADQNDTTVEVGWDRFLNAFDYPMQLLVRQHLPRLDLVREELLQRRPEDMRHGKIGIVADSLVSLLRNMEASGRVVDRRCYAIAAEGHVQQVNAILMRSNLYFARLQGIPLRDMLVSCFSGISPYPDFESEIPDFQALEFRTGLELPARFVTCYEITEFPRVMMDTFLEGILATGIEMDISIYVWPVHQQEAQSRLRTQLVRWNGQRVDLLQRGRVVPPDVDMVVQDVDRLWTNLQRGITRLFRVSLTMAVYGRSKAELSESSGVLTNYFRSQMARVRPMTFRHSNGYRTVMPTMKSGEVEPYLTDKDTMLRMFPFSPPDMDTRGGTLLGLDRRSRAPIIYDCFDASRMNGHMVIMARSGAGKSFFTKLRVIREATRGVPVYLIDPDGEYGQIAEALGGRVLVPGRPGYGMNPFAITFQDVGTLKTRIANLCCLVEIMLEGNVDLQAKSIIDRCMSGFYVSRLRRLRENGIPLVGQQLASGGMRELYGYLKSREAPEGAVWMAEMMERFATGSVQYLMSSSEEGVSNDLMTNELPVTTFNLRNLSPALKPVATSVCAEVVWGLATTQPKPRIMVVDECWTVLATPQGAEALLTIAKRARKYRLALIAITQDVQDLLAEDKEGGMQGHAGLSLLQNAADKFVLAQDDNVIDQVCDVLGLTPQSSEYLRTVGRGQGLLVSTRNGQFPVDVLATREEADLLEDRGWLHDGDELPAEMELQLLEDYLDSGRTNLLSDPVGDIEGYEDGVRLSEWVHAAGGNGNVSAGVAAAASPGEMPYDLAYGKDINGHEVDSDGIVAKALAGNGDDEAERLFRRLLEQERAENSLN